MSVCSQILRIANDTSSKCLYFRIFFNFSFMVTVFFKLKEFRITAMFLDNFCGPGSSVGIATEYGLDGRGSNPGGDEIFRPFRPALGPTQPPVKWVPRLSRG